MKRLLVQTAVAISVCGVFLLCPFRRLHRQTQQVHPNPLYNGESDALIVHRNDHHSIWIQETFNKVVTIPWYTTASVGYAKLVALPVE